jgi:integrase
LRLSEALARLLEDHRQGSRWAKAADWVFSQEDGSPHNPDKLRFNVLYPAMERAGIERVKSAYGFHIFRHSAGSLVHTLTRDLKMAQEFLRHSSIDTTADIYVHVNERVAEEATEALAKVIFPNCGPVVAQKVETIQ